MRMRDVSLCVTSMLVAAAFTTGCATTANVRPNLVFADRSPNIETRGGLYIAATTKEHVVKASYFGTEYRIPLGQAMEPNARASLAKVLSSVEVLDSKTGDNVDRVFEIQVDPRSSIDLGTFTFSANAVKVCLTCNVYDKQGQCVWSQYLEEEGKKRSWWGFLGGLAGNYGYISSLRLSAEAGLQKALEKLNDKVLEDRQKVFAQ